MMANKSKYTVELIKGTGLVPETMTLLENYEGQDKNTFVKYILDNNILATSSERRAKDIVSRVFFKRYVDPDIAIATQLKTIREKGLPLKQFKQLLYLYTARVDTVLRDFITDVLNPIVKEGKVLIDDGAPKAFIEHLNEEEGLNWNEGNIRRVASGLHKVLIDFDILSKKNDITFDGISSFVFLYILHDLHFKGLSDKEVWEHPDWKLFFLDRYAVLDLIKEHSLRDGYIAQSSGDLLAITWNYKSMEEMINGIL